MRHHAERVATVLFAAGALAVAGACGGDAGEAGGASRAGDAGAEPLHADAAPWTPELAAELRRMHEADQAVRESFGAGTVGDTAFMARMLRTDSAHSLRLRELVERHGWPSAADVGDEAADGAFLVVQHTPFHEWQRAMLPLLEAAVARGEADGQSYALLHDRVMMHQGLPQRYGTQLRSGDDGRFHLHALEDTAAVDSLRAQLGLPPLAAYLELVAEQTGIEVAPFGPSGGS